MRAAARLGVIIEGDSSEGGVRVSHFLDAALELLSVSDYSLAEGRAFGGCPRVVHGSANAAAQLPQPPRAPERRTPDAGP